MTVSEKVGDIGGPAATDRPNAEVCMSPVYGKVRVRVRKQADRNEGFDERNPARLL